MRTDSGFSAGEEFTVSVHLYCIAFSGDEILRDFILITIAQILKSERPRAVCDL